MALSVKRGIITAPAGTGQQSYDVGFLPKAVIVWTTNQTAVDTTSADCQLSFGFGTYRGSVVQQAYVALFDDDATAAQTVCRSKGTGSLLRVMTADANPPTTGLDVDLVSFSGTSFTLDYVTASSGAKIHYIALGGSDITDARVGNFTCPSTTNGTTQDVTVATGFGQPDLMFFLNGERSGDTHAQGNASIGLGVAKSDTVRRASATGHVDAGTSMSIALLQKQRAMVSITSVATDAEVDLSARAAWPTDGFEVTWVDASATTNVVHYLALKGTFQSAIGVNTAPTAGALPVVQDNAAGFAPSLGFVWSGNMAASATIYTAGTDLHSWGVGATDGTTEGWASISQDDAAADSVAKRRHNESKTLQFFNVTPALQSEADGSFSGNNFRLSWNDIDTVAREYNYLVLGSAPAGGQSVAVGLVSETDTAQALTRSKARAVGLVTETDAALSITPFKARAVGLVTETNTAQPLSRSKAKAVGLATETDTALPLTAVKTVAVGQVVETDTALPIAAKKTLAVGLAEETDQALPITVAGSGGGTRTLALLDAGS